MSEFGIFCCMWRNVCWHFYLGMLGVVVAALALYIRFQTYILLNHTDFWHFAREFLAHAREFFRVARECLTR